MPAEIKTLHVFHCICGKEATQECVTQVGYQQMPPMNPSPPSGWKIIGHFTLCPDEIIDLTIFDKDRKRIWFENNDWMGE